MTATLDFPAEPRGFFKSRYGSTSLRVGVATTWLSVIVLLPLAAIVWQSAGGGWDAFWTAVTSNAAMQSFRVTLTISFAVAVVNLFFGLLVAWVLTRDEFPGKRLVDAIIDLPFALPTIVASLVMLALYGPSSPVGIHIQHTKWGVGIALLFVTLPFVVRSVQPVLLELDREVDKAAVLDRREGNLHEREDGVRAREAELHAALGEQQRKLEQVAGLTAAEARSALVKHIEDAAKREAMALVRDLEQQAREEADRRARKIVTLAIQRVASEQTTESTVAVLPLPSDDMKGRIIGREGRNIRAYEATTGVNLIIDDTPEAVLLSCFDPVRREIGRLTLEKLVADGRIHPARIEETFDRAKLEVEEEVRRSGEDACLEIGITDLHPDLVRVLGQLKYRTSYGQNVLRHLVETAHLAGVMASELGTDVALAKRCAFLHDIGKALTHEVEGSHAIIGAELARRLKEPAEVVHAIEAHHGEVEQRTIEAVICQAADAISGGRPGARRETLESYVKRLERLEEIATGYAGVGKVFAMQAGREVRIMVRPEDVDDLGAQVLARDIAKRVEQELQYPGQIRITVVREVRSVEYAK